MHYHSHLEEANRPKAIRGSAIGGGAFEHFDPMTSAGQAITQVESQMPQLARTSERLYACIAELDGLMSKLESSLEPVLNPPSPANANGTAAPDPVRCPIGRSMDARSDEVCAITARVRSLLDRLAC